MSMADFAKTKTLPLITLIGNRVIGTSESQTMNRPEGTRRKMVIWRSSDRETQELALIDVDDRGIGNQKAKARPGITAPLFTEEANKEPQSQAPAVTPPWQPPPKS